MILFFLALVVSGYFAYRAYFTPEALSRREVEKWIDIIGSWVELPRDERPTLATVTNRSRIDDQPFLEGAENGDKILLYPRAGEAVLFRPSTGRVLGITTDVNIEMNR